MTLFSWFVEITGKQTGKPDANAIFGSMDNGFEYIIYPNSEPPGKFSVRLHVAAGSLMEDFLSACEFESFQTSLHKSAAD